LLSVWTSGCFGSGLRLWRYVALHLVRSDVRGVTKRFSGIERVWLELSGNMVAATRCPISVRNVVWISGKDFRPSGKPEIQNPVSPACAATEISADDASGLVAVLLDAFAYRPRPQSFNSAISQRIVPLLPSGSRSGHDAAKPRNWSRPFLTNEFSYPEAQFQFGRTLVQRITTSVWGGAVHQSWSWKVQK
jgi:hypothetical protein